MENTKKISENLMAAIFEVFEKMYYLFIEPEDAEGGDYQMAASVRFGGPADGTIEIFVSRGVGQNMAQNMLSLEADEVNEMVMADCVKESINMICGNFVRRLDPEKVFPLTIPTFTRLSETFRLPATADGQIGLAFAADGGQIAVQMTAPGLVRTAGR